MVIMMVSEVTFVKKHVLDTFKNCAKLRENWVKVSKIISREIGGREGSSRI